MAKVHFAPYGAVKYVGSKSKEFAISLARPKPKLRRGDIYIVDKKIAFNLIHKGFGEFVAVDGIEFVKDDVENGLIVKELEEKIADYEAMQQPQDEKDEIILELQTKIAELEATLLSLQNSDSVDDISGADEINETDGIDETTTEDVKIEDNGK